MEVLELVFFWVLIRTTSRKSTKLEWVPSVCLSVNIKMLDFRSFQTVWCWYCSGSGKEITSFNDKTVCSCELGLGNYPCPWVTNFSCHLFILFVYWCSYLKVALLSLLLDVLKAGTCIMPWAFQIHSKKELQRLLVLLFAGNLYS